jgi:biotin carboxyl carrier protein
MKQYKIRVGGKEYMVEVEEITSGNEAPSPAKTVVPSQPTGQREQPKPPEIKKTKSEVKPTAAASAVEGEEIKAPMPGKILKINISVGDSVNEGDTVLILEAMKMENEIVTNSGGRVKKISVSVNDMVETDDTLVIIG